jgi:hypothetical protein
MDSAIRLALLAVSKLFFSDFNKDCFKQRCQLGVGKLAMQHQPHQGSEHG